MAEEDKFFPFQKIPRYESNVIVTEKIDGTNGLIHITHEGAIRAGSRNRWLTAEKDNFGFAKWVDANKEDLLKLGPGLHYGEWWGSGIQRGYGLKNGERRFSLFRADLFEKLENKPLCCTAVPVLYRGTTLAFEADECLNMLATEGSRAAPGFMSPEGIIIFHTNGRNLYKHTFEPGPKGEPKAPYAEPVSETA